jgi:DNA-binding beta-propeller fold protein YncE
MRPLRRLAALTILAALVVPAAAAAKPSREGALTQLQGPRGCLVDAAARQGPCARARALDGPGPFMGSQAIALSPDGRNAYVASSRSDAIAILKRNRRNGALSQPKGAAGCIAARGADGCATAVGLDGPNSVAVSPDGRSVYATSRASGSITTFRRAPRSGRLVQSGCASSAPLPGCVPARALAGADVVAVSPDGENVYVGAFFGDSVATFDRDPDTGALTQPADGTGCMTEQPTSGCASAIALDSPEGMAVSPDGGSVYVASAVSNAVAILVRDPDTGALDQGTDGAGCIVDEALAGCTTGYVLAGANAVAVSADGDDAYVTSLLSNSVTSFARSGTTLTQKPGTSGCMVFLAAVGCSLAHALSAPEGIAASPDGHSVYAASFASGAIAVLDRDGDGDVVQKSGKAGCVARRGVPNCRPGRRMRKVSSVALSPDGRFVYAVAFGSDAVVSFRRAAR